MISYGICLSLSSFLCFLSLTQHLLAQSISTYLLYPPSLCHWTFPLSRMLGHPSFLFKLEIPTHPLWSVLCDSFLFIPPYPYPLGGLSLLCAPIESFAFFSYCFITCYSCFLDSCIISCAITGFGTARCLIKSLLHEWLIWVNYCQIRKMIGKTISVGLCSIWYETWSSAYSKYSEAEPQLSRWASYPSQTLGLIGCFQMFKEHPC